MKILSKLGSTIEVRQSWGAKSLYINGCPQSQGAYRRDWKTILSKAGVDQLPKLGSALVLGLGGGDLAKILEKRWPNWFITFVELESEVVLVAEKYFGVGNTVGRKIVVADAEKYMTKNITKYNLVIVDLYSGDDVPKFVAGDKFLRQVALALTPHGKAIFNYASHSFRENDFAEFEKKLHKYFSQVEKLKSWGHTYYLTMN